MIVSVFDIDKGFVAGDKSVDSDYVLKSNERKKEDTVNFFKPRLVGKDLVEGAEGQILVSYHKNRKGELTTKLQEEVANLMIGAKKIAIGKDGSREYIDSQEKLYLHKYRIAIGELEDVNGMIQREGENHGYTWQAYKELIINRYKAGEKAYFEFISMIEIARGIVIDYMEGYNYSKAEYVLELMKSVETTTPIVEIQNTMNLILTA
jgi:hypothetical protein